MESLAVVSLVVAVLSLALTVVALRRTRPAGDTGAEELPEDVHGLGRSFDEDVEAEVAELLGEIEPPTTGDADVAEETRGEAADEQH